MLNMRYALVWRGSPRTIVKFTRQEVRAGLDWSHGRHDVRLSVQGGGLSRDARLYKTGLHMAARRRGGGGQVCIGAIGRDAGGGEYDRARHAAACVS